ncbi:MAG: toxin-antitoxin system YwqK family antitoxin [bacterium]|nr:toxin-antitoxin system YwqK family antitoxin [bacterium]
MNPVPLFLIIVTLPLLLGGCGEKPVAETKPVEEKVLEVKEEAKTEEPLVETKPELEGVNKKELEERLFGEDGFTTYYKGSDTLYTGKAFGLHENGQKRWDLNYKNGKRDGLWVAWHENGQKSSEYTYKDGKEDGLATMWYSNGQKEGEINYKGGKPDGLRVAWHENGQKREETNYKDDEIVSEKFWNSKGEPVDSRGEARK